MFLVLMRVGTRIFQKTQVRPGHPETRQTGAHRKTAQQYKRNQRLCQSTVHCKLHVLKLCSDARDPGITVPGMQKLPWGTCRPCTSALTSMPRCVPGCSGGTRGTCMRGAVSVSVWSHAVPMSLPRVLLCAHATAHNVLWPWDSQQAPGRSYHGPCVDQGSFRIGIQTPACTKAVLR